jgi:hypothetical protein
LPVRWTEFANVGVLTSAIANVKAAAVVAEAMNLIDNLLE